MMKFPEAFAGEMVTDYAKRLIDYRNYRQHDINGEFNGVTVIVTEESTPESIYEDYKKQLEEQQKAYEQTEEYKLRQIEREERAKNLNYESTYMLGQLFTINWSNYDQILTWLHDYQPISDHVDVKVPKEQLIKLFTENGYGINVNTGKNFDKENEENFARYIIGQALDNFEHVGAIHPILQKFVNDWKEKFGYQAVS